MSLSTTAGWQIAQSIALELDVALTMASGYHALAGMPSQVAELVQSLPPDWLAQWKDFLGPPRNFIGVLKEVAELADVEWEADYSRATLAMRELTLEQALTSLEQRARLVGISTAARGTTEEKIKELVVKFTIALASELGFQRLSERVLTHQVETEMAAAIGILHGGEVHTRFWHWLDRFYYEFYRPWRDLQTEAINNMQQRALMILGAQQREGTPPDTTWLPAQNPLRVHPQLASAVADGRLRVFFWVEPFNLFDYWFLQPGLVALTFAEPGQVYQNFQASATDVASRLKALSDPTRLMILRLIRYFSLDNTTMANYLNITRPTVSVHAKILRQAGLIRTHREGRQVHHELIPEEVWQLLHDLERFLDLPEK